MSPTQTSPPRTSKLGPHKVSLACNFCRARKRKCDGSRPICGYCRTMKNLACTFDVHSDKRKPVPRSYVTALEARIRTLEDVIRAMGGTLPPADASLDSFESEDAGHGLGASSHGSPETSHPPEEPRPILHERLPEDSGASVEAILDIGRLRLSVSEDTDPLAPESSANFRYYGPTSSRFLSGTGASERPAVGLFGHCSVRDSLNERKTTNLFDNPLETELLNKFWKWQEIHCTIVDREIFLEAYQKGERDSEWVSPMLIDMMLAIGVQFGHQGHGRKAIYSTRAEALVMHEIGQPTMATMQAVQLMSLFQIGAGRVSVGWSLNGLAVAMSNKMGLHIDSTELVARGSMSQRMSDMRTMAFWGIFVLDRLSSIIMGVHPLHNRRSISTRRLPGSIRPSILPSNVKLAGGEPIKIINHHTLAPMDGSWIRFNDLADIVETMLMDIYAFDAPTRTAMEDYNMLTKNNQILQAYIDDLPTGVTVEKVFAGKVTNLRPVALHIFINLFILLINRPFIGPRQHIASPQSASAGAANQVIERRCRALAFGQCRDAALNIIRLVKYFVHTPCFTTAYDIFTACTILLLCPQDPDAMKAVRTGLAHLDQLKQNNYWVESAEDSKQRILDLAQKWNVSIIPEGFSPASSHSQPSSHLSTPPQGNNDTTALLTNEIDPTLWQDLTQPIDWSALSIPDIQPNPFTGPDAALFTAYPSTELGTMYEQFGVPMDLTTDFSQELNALWYLGSSPIVESQKPVELSVRAGQCCGQCGGV
ncbi:nitrogen assimilation transcription factor nira protein [Rhizoctonia solani 123E]|uniref:Nitrogen assimilation transcription factor nira protein n=1 Tax=Rhizoctonia solani 123E TaxID=1423351 RepID=A0A074S3B7_9AGAM|nr:nitrogen assimilation transcription factor nira protein [Rhizoctonia solani 123E]